MGFEIFKAIVFYFFVIALISLVVIALGALIVGVINVPLSLL